MRGEKYAVFFGASIVGLCLTRVLFVITEHYGIIWKVEYTLFAFSIFVSFIFFSITIAIKRDEENKANTIIILNLQKILSHSNKIQDMEKTPQNFKLGTGPYGLPVSISDYILLISNNIKHTLHFTNSMATTGSINLVHDIFEILPELKKILERMDYTDPTSLEQKFNQEWVLFHSKITKFVNFTVREYDNDVNNSEKYTSKFIKYDLD